MSQNQKPLLAGDIGGTKTVLALYDPAQGPYDAIVQATFPSREYASLEAIVAEFLQDRNGSVCRASFGIAGPVADGRVQATNLPWVVEEQAFGAWLGALELFCDILAAEAGNLALRVLASGGVYLGGGLPLRLLRFLQANAFLRAFSDKGRFSDFLKRTPLHVIRHPQAALFGAACHGLELEGYHA